MPPIYDDIRHAIAASDKSRYRLWQETGISQGQLSVEAIEKLAACMDLEITVRPMKRTKTSKKGI